MRIIVFSDSHGKLDNVLKIFEREPSADMFIFLGDGERDVDTASCLYPDRKVLSVCGNCDFCSMNPGLGIVKVCGKQIVYVHGNAQNVKSTKDYLYRLAKDYEAQIVLFGHTHKRLCEYNDGVYLINPGSAGCSCDGYSPSYALLDVTDKGVLCSHVDL